MNRASLSWATWVKQQRGERTQAKFAALLGVHPSYVSRMENHGWLPYYHTCVDMAERLGVDKTEMLRAAGYA